jgi:hypothetical protein
MQVTAELFLLVPNYVPLDMLKTIPESYAGLPR